MDVVEPSSHEFTANFIFDQYGLDPYFGADAQVKEVGGSHRQTFEDQLGERWVATLYVTKRSGFLPPDGGKTQYGTDFDLDVVREFRISVKALGDPAGQRSFNAHISPRWQGMKAEKKDGSIIEYSVPEGIVEGVNIRIAGSNIEFDRYHQLLQDAADAVGINGWYFLNPHEFSNVVDASREVRLYTDRSGPVHARDGPIAQLGHLLEHDRTGYRKVVQNDIDEHANNRPGYYHTVTLGEKRVKTAFSDHTFPREIKHYYALEWKQYDPDHPLHHPKVGVSYQTSLWDESIGVDEIDELVRQLDQTLHSVLADAGLQVHAGRGDPFVADAYFEPANVHKPSDWICELNLTTIKHDQESVVLKYLADGLSPVDWENLSTLVADGGVVSPDDLAAVNGRHVDSVRRSLRRMEELIDREYGAVRLRSPFIAELIHKKIQIAREAARDAIEASAKIAHAAEAELDEHTSAFIAWAASVGADVNDVREARMLLRMPHFDHRKALRYQLRKGFELWTAAGNDPYRFQSADIELADGSKSTVFHML